MIVSTLRVFEKGTKGYERLEAASKMVNAFTNENTTVRTIYFDYGQDWKFTTVVADYQVLTPAMQELIINGDLKQFQEVVNEVIEKINKRGW